MGSTNPIRITTSVDLAGLTQYNAAVNSVAVANEKAAASFAAPIAASREFAAEIRTVASSNENAKALFNDAAAAATNEGYSIREARGSARLLADELGLHLNRELANTVARSSIVGPVIEKAFSVFALVGFLELAGQIPGVIKGAAEAIMGWDEAAKKAYQDAIDENTKLLVANVKNENEIRNMNQIGKEGMEKYALATSDAKANSASLGRELDVMNRMLEAQEEKLKPLQSLWGKVIEETTVGVAGIKEAEKAVEETIRGDRAAVNELKADIKAQNDEILRAGKEGGVSRAADIRAENAAKIAATKEGAEASIAYEQGEYKRRYELLQISLEQETALLQDAERRKLDVEIKADEALKRVKSSEGAATGKDMVPEIEAINARETAARARANTEIENLGTALQVALRKQAEETRDAGIRNAKELEEAKKRLSEQTAHDLNDDAKKQVEDARRNYEENFSYAEKAANRELEMQTRLHRDSISAKREDLAAWYSELSAALDRELAAARKNGYESADDYRRIILRKEDLDKEYADKKKAIDDKIVAAEEKTLTTIGNAFNGAVGQWIGGEKKFGDAMAEEWNKLLTTATDNILKIGEQWLIGLLLHKSAAEQDILVSAKTAAAGAYAAMAPIPIVGPELGAIAAAVTFAAVAALGSFAEGGIVPATGTAMLHGGEMVLPAHISNFIQQAAGEGGGSSSSTSTTNHYHTSVQFHNHAGNSRDVLSAENELVRAIAKATRRGRIGQ